MRFDVLTLFPKAFDSFMGHSIVKRAIRSAVIQVNTRDIRSHARHQGKRVDDLPYGGGAGMVMTCQPLADAIESVKAERADNAPVIYLTPQGEKFSQPLAEELSQAGGRLILLCGHYEGIDQRIRDGWVDREISIGDYVLSGGELAAQILIDAVMRLLPGALGAETSHLEESFSAALDRQLEYPHYTRPQNFRGHEVPAVLLSGHHQAIADWRRSKLTKRDPV